MISCTRRKENEDVDGKLESTLSISDDQASPGGRVGHRGSGVGGNIQFREVCEGSGGSRSGGSGAR
jgi:hypothetical protein